MSTTATEESTIAGLDADLVERIRLVYANNNHSYLTLLIVESEDPDLLEEGVNSSHLDAFNDQLKSGFRCDWDGFYWTERLLSVSPKALCQDSCWLDYLEGEG